MVSLVLMFKKMIEDLCLGHIYLYKDKLEEYQNKALLFGVPFECDFNTIDNRLVPLDTEIECIRLIQDNWGEYTTLVCFKYSIMQYSLTYLSNLVSDWKEHLDIDIADVDLWKKCLEGKCDYTLNAFSIPISNISLDTWAVLCTKTFRYSDYIDTCYHHFNGGPWICSITQNDLDYYGYNMTFNISRIENVVFDILVLNMNFQKGSLKELEGIKFAGFSFEGYIELDKLLDRLCDILGDKCNDTKDLSRFAFDISNISKVLYKVRKIEIEKLENQYHTHIFSDREQYKLYLLRCLNENIEMKDISKCDITREVVY